ncbi:MAG: matrixin family metalloprotease [Patescibacteria group bacterium]
MKTHMFNATKQNKRQKKSAVSFSKKLIIFANVLMLGAAGSTAAFAYNYAGYRWGGTWPKVTVDYSGVAVTAWRIRVQNTINDWNATSAKYTFQAGSSKNDVSVYYVNDSTLAYVQTTRKYVVTGNIVKAIMKINSRHNFNPPYTNGYDFSTVMRHEFGHWLKLNHSTSPSLMQPSFSPGEIRYVDTDMRNAIRSIYGAQ